jgi:hypothetical protein
MTLADELLLLAYTDEGSSDLSQYSLDLGLSGAVLLDLAMAGKFDVRDKKLVVSDATPVGDTVLDKALATVATEKKARSPQDWVQRLAGSELREQVLDGLIDAGVLTREKDRVLGIFPRTRFPSTHGVEPPQETDARQRLTAALDGPDPVEPRTAALAALVQATGLSGKVFDGRKGRDVKKRVEQMTEASLTDDSWASESVRKAIEAVETGMMTAIIVATTVSTAVTIQ